MLRRTGEPDAEDSTGRPSASSFAVAKLASGVGMRVDGETGYGGLNLVGRPLRVLQLQNSLVESVCEWTGKLDAEDLTWSAVRFKFV